jgi:hypothetical protein
MQTLNRELARERGAKEQAERAAEAARGRLAELEKAQEEPGTAPPEPEPAAASVAPRPKIAAPRKAKPSQAPSRKAEEQPMPALVP